MQDFHKQLIGNITAFAAQERALMPKNMDREQVFEYVQQRADRGRMLMAASNRIIAEFLQPMFDDPLALEDAAAQSYTELACALYSQQQYVDMGLAFPVHEALLKRARARGDVDGIVLHSYWLGMIYLQSPLSLYWREALACFEEGASFIKQYYDLESSATRMLINRCLGNVYVAKSGKRKEDVPSYTSFLEAVDQAVQFWNNPQARALDPDFPWEAFIRNSHQNICAWVDQLRLKLVNDAYLASRVYESALALYGAQMTDDAPGFPNSRVAYMVIAAKYHKGLITAQEAFDSLYKMVQSVAPDDYSQDALRLMMHTSIVSLYYQENIPDIPKELFDQTRTELLQRVFAYCSALPPEVERFNVNARLSILAPALREMPSKAFIRALLRLTTFTHMPTYVHSLMVGKLMRLLAEYFLDTAPEHMIGVCGMQTMQAVLEAREHVLNEVELAGLAHDAGKTVYINTITLCSRKLTDLEFAIIKEHTGTGFFMLEQCAGQGCIADVVRGHHRWYDGSRGYPSDFDNCASPHRFAIDLASVADSIDAATDSVGRSYATQKTLDAVIAEIHERAGTQYSPIVASALNDPALVHRIHEILESYRKDAYYLAYCELYGAQGQ